MQFYYHFRVVGSCCIKPLPADIASITIHALREILCILKCNRKRWRYWAYHIKTVENRTMFGLKDMLSDDSCRYFSGSRFIEPDIGNDCGYDKQQPYHNIRKNMT